MKHFFLAGFLALSVGILFTIEPASSDNFACLDCHDELTEGSVHEGEVSCGSCHIDVKDEMHIDEGAAPVDCARCHAAQKGNTIHQRMGVDLNGGEPTCKSCHGDHQVKHVSVIKDRNKVFCGSCHESDVYTARFHAPPDEAAKCESCHKEADYTAMMQGSIHEAFACTDCHGYISRHIEEHQKGLEYAQVASCGVCHSEIADIHSESIHGISLEEGILEAAYCWDCHGSHDVVKVASRESPVHTHNLPQTCGNCHDNPEFINKYSLTMKQPAMLYTKSVHGRLVAEGNEDAATCIDCHGVHDIKNRIQPGSHISSFEIPNTCEKCHPEDVANYKQSIHWIRAKKGIREAPVCNYCHSEHSIQAIKNITDPTELRIMQEKTCYNCHTDPKIVERFGIEGNVQEYRDSYHGLAVMRGDPDAAMCIDCHNIHKILPTIHPESSVNDANVKETCQRCHPEATQLFSESYDHKPNEATMAAENIVDVIYFWMILLVVGGMVIHNLLIMVKEMVKRKKNKRSGITVPRFNMNEVIQHFILLLSFIILAITGFALKFPNSWWVETLASLGMTEAARQLTHRISGVVLLALGLYHIGYLIFTGRGRDILNNLMPRIRDIRDMVQNVSYYLGIRKKQPTFDQYNYIEKAEYWALIWGTLLMGVTGLVLWFPTIVTDNAPVWLIKASELVHYYEAILASASILVWHWYFVIFHPDVYPVSLTWVDGKMHIDEYKHHHKDQVMKMVEEWEHYRADNGLPYRKLSSTTKMLVKQLEKKGIDPDVAFEEIKRDL